MIPQVLSVRPEPKFELSPFLYMQFMEPLGDHDPSVEAAWDFQRDKWHDDVIGAARRLGPTMIRWGGIFSSYYKWREGVGPRGGRRPMYNIAWGGMESNQVGTHEFVGFCRKVRAEPLICVNFASDGKARWAHPLKGGARAGTAAEAAAWVRYCNDPADRDRRRNGADRPLKVRYWQIGNETSYGKGGFDCETAGRYTARFARAMRRADRNIKLIGWGDSGWAPRMIELAGEQLDYLAFHHHFQSGLPDSPLVGEQYRKDPARTWDHLMNAWKSTQEKIDLMRQQVAGAGLGLAMTESHFSLPGRNRCEVLSSWAAGVAYARILNVHARNGDLLKIATLADFIGTQWQVVALMVRPRGQSYLMPVGSVMSLFRHHTGRHAVEVVKSPAGIDATASMTGRRVFLHVVNTSRTRAARVRVEMPPLRIKSGRVFMIAADPQTEVMETCPDVFSVKERALAPSGVLELPPAAVAAVEMETAPFPMAG
ncbi:MAG: alpha-L-arabinofuranosidase [Phycisphaerae bacterium]